MWYTKYDKGIVYKIILFKTLARKERFAKIKLLNLSNWMKWNTALGVIGEDERCVKGQFFPFLKSGTDSELNAFNLQLKVHLKRRKNYTHLIKNFKKSKEFEYFKLPIKWKLILFADLSGI